MIVWKLLLPCAALFSSQGFDQEMTAQEKKMTGIYKLSNGEKKNLQQWIEKHYGNPRDNEPLLEKTASKKTALTLTENLYNGRYIRLSDNSLWEIDPANVSIVQGWITPVEILETPSENSKYPHTLTNSLTGSSVRARPAKTTPQSPSAYPSAEGSNGSASSTRGNK